MSTQAMFWVRGMLVRYTTRWETLAGTYWRIAGPETKAAITSHLCLHCAADDYPSAEASEALRPVTVDGLRLVPKSEATPANWLARAQVTADQVNATEFGIALLSVDGDHWTLRITTGGWSPCEAIVDELGMGHMRGDLFWMLFWESSKRGGLHVFRCDLGKEST